MTQSMGGARALPFSLKVASSTDRAFSRSIHFTSCPRDFSFSLSILDLLDIDLLFSYPWQLRTLGQAYSTLKAL